MKPALFLHPEIARALKKKNPELYKMLNVVETKKLRKGKGMTDADSIADKQHINSLYEGVPVNHCLAVFRGRPLEEYDKDDLIKLIAIASYYQFPNLA